MRKWYHMKIWIWHFLFQSFSFLQTLEIKDVIWSILMLLWNYDWGWQMTFSWGPRSIYLNLDLLKHEKEVKKILCRIQNRRFTNKVTIFIVVSKLPKFFVHCLCDVFDNTCWNIWIKLLVIIFEWKVILLYICILYLLSKVRQYAL